MPVLKVNPQPIDRPVEFFAEDWNSDLSSRHRMLIHPTYARNDLFEVQIRLTRSRYMLGRQEWLDFNSDLIQQMPKGIGLTSTRQSFGEGVIAFSVNPLSQFYKEEDVAEFLSWFGSDFLNKIQRS